MRVGIITHYRRCDTTFAALQLAQYLLGLGEVTVLTTTSTPVQLHPAVDAVRLRTSELTYGQPFTGWISLLKPTSLSGRSARLTSK